MEVFVRELEVLGASEELPLMVFGDQEYPEETRLRYRFLDLRREKMQANMKLRSDVVRSIRQRMWDKDFNEFQTPIITASSPEGARDFLVPSTPASGQILRAAAGSAAVQAVAHGFRASTSISRSRPASATKTRAPTAARPISTSSTWKCRSSPNRTCSTRSSR